MHPRHSELMPSAFQLGGPVVDQFRFQRFELADAEAAELMRADATDSAYCKNFTSEKSRDFERLLGLGTFVSCVSLGGVKLLFSSAAFLKWAFATPAGPLVMEALLYASVGLLAGCAVGALALTVAEAAGFMPCWLAEKTK